MKFRDAIIYLIVLICISDLKGQSSNLEDLLAVNEKWSDKEVFHFPISFAPEIPFEGTEEARFLKGWGDPNSQEFWSYIFVWDIAHKKNLTIDDFRENLRLYFDGLMKGRIKNKGIKSMATEVELKEIKVLNYTTFYEGKAKILDAFRTDKPLVLNLKIEHFQCESKGESLVVFKLSPQNFGHSVWKDIEMVKPTTKICE